MPQRCHDAGQRNPAVRGTTCGAYRITAKIGEDEMGEVYQARDTSLDRDVAINVRPEAFATDPANSPTLTAAATQMGRHVGTGRHHRVRHGEVDRARGTTLDRDVALKVAPSRSTSDVAWFANERKR